MTDNQENRDFYAMGRAHCRRDIVFMDRPPHWRAKQWFAYQDGVADEYSDMYPDIVALMNEQHADSF